jgi:AcrR family transcriptional regulator
MSAIATTEDDTKSSRRSDTRDRLLTAAIELFGTRGYDSTSLRDIASEVGIKAPAIYNHFDSKEQLLGEAVVWMIGDFMANVVEPDEPTLDAAQRIRGLMRRHITYQLDRGALVRANDLLVESDALRLKMAPEAAAKVRGDMRRYLDLLTELIADLKSTGRVSYEVPRLGAFAIISMCDRVQTWYRPDGALDEAQVAEHFWRFAEGALGLS